MWMWIHETCDQPIYGHKVTAIEWRSTVNCLFIAEHQCRGAWTRGVCAMVPGWAYKDSGEVYSRDYGYYTHTSDATGTHRKTTHCWYVCKQCNISLRKIGVFFSINLISFSTFWLSLDICPYNLEKPFWTM